MNGTAKPGIVNGWSLMGEGNRREWGLGAEAREGGGLSDEGLSAPEEVLTLF